MKIHIGCGKRNFGPGWVHIDGEKFDHVDSSDIYLSCIENNSVTLIYSAHFLEYFDRDEAIILLDAWYRKLKDGGVLRLAVPDFEAMARLYTEGKFKIGSFLGPLYGRMTMDGKTIYHKTVYDFDSIATILGEILSFQEIRYYDWESTEHKDIDDHSQAFLPHMDKENGTLISLNIEAIK